jgi:peptidoglycan/LPS O-acetylase OafA/YrhL
MAMTTQSRDVTERLKNPTVIPITRKGSRIPELDGWRAISVLLVIAAHFVVLHHPVVLEKHPILAPAFRSFGPLGVSVFFIISGFVICRLLMLEEEQTGSVSLKGFYYRRAFRILPPFMLYLFVLLILEFLHFIYERRFALLWSGLFLCDSNLAPRTPFIAHTWSLAVEEQFYLIFPTAWLLIPSKWRIRACFSAFLICALWGLWRIHAGPMTILVSGAPASFSCICFGVLLALCEKRARRVVSRIPSLVVLFLVLVAVIPPASAGSWQLILFGSLIYPPIVGLTLLFSVENRGWLSRFLCSPPLQKIGVMSYGAYLWQELFTASDASYAAKGFWIRNGLPLLLIVVPLSYTFIEKPAMRLGKRLSERAKAISLQHARELLTPAQPGV